MTLLPSQDLPTTTGTTSGAIVTPPTMPSRAELLEWRAALLKQLRAIETALGMAHSVPARREKGGT